MADADAGNLNPHASELRDPQGQWLYTNALVTQTSPYLLQHAHNPVDWHPWGPDAFALAARLNQPIFLSVGYSTCYWCHVMERESFENLATATLLNQNFVNIKVDREERPDVDDIYMIALQAITGRGGWPMSLFLTPPQADGPDDMGLKPFFAGSYYPPQPRYNMPSFSQVLLGVAAAWKDRRPDLLTQSRRIAQAVQGHLGQDDLSGELSLEMVQSAAHRLLSTYDSEHGGFGSAPKFPTPVNLFFLMSVHAHAQDDDIWKALAHTLARMARGGMYDQIGGGFHRYSVDERWLVPHFEKMLYDNGQLLQVYALAQQTRPDERDADLYPRVLRQSIDWVLREMTDLSGAFWSAQDAEVQAREGESYLWTPAQVDAALNDPYLAALARQLYGLDQGTNFQDPHDPQAQPANVLHQPMALMDLAQSRGESLPWLLKAKARLDEALLEARRQRPQPTTDDKVLVSWNGWTIAGLARAGTLLDEPRYIQAAARAAQAILDNLRTADGGLYRAWRGGQARVDAFLEDYAFFAHGLIELHRATAKDIWLQQARDMDAQARRRFAHPQGGYFDTLADQGDLFVRTRSVYDGALPSGNSQMVHNLLDFYELTRDRSYLDQALNDLRAMAGAMVRNPAGMAHMHGALLRALTLEPAAAAQTPIRQAPAGRREVVAVDVEPMQMDLTVFHVADPAQAPPQRLTITLRIGPEYHLNAHQPGLEGLVPTTLTLHDAPGLELHVQYPPGQERRFPLADRPLRVYQGLVELPATLRATGLVQPGIRPRLVLRYQVCTDRSCLAAREAELPLRME